MRGGDLPFVKVTWQDRDISQAVVSADVEDDDRLADKATLRISDRIAGVVMQAGQPLRIETGWNTEHAVLFDGYVSEFESRSTGGASGHDILVRALDRSAPMNAERKTRSLPPGRLSGIVRTIVAAYQIPVGRISVDPDPEFTAGRPLQQTEESDLVLLQRLAARYRARAFVEINAGRPEFWFVSERELLAAPPVGEVRYRGGQGELRSFRFAADPWRGGPSLRAETQDPRTGAPARTEPAPPAPLPPIAGDRDGARRVAGADGARQQAYQEAIAAAQQPGLDPALIGRSGAVAGLPSDPALAAQAAQPDATARHGYRAEGVLVGNVHLRAKSLLTVKDLDPRWAEGDWYLRRVVHAYRAGGGRGGQAGGYETLITATR